LILKIYSVTNDGDTYRHNYIYRKHVLQWTNEPNLST